MNSVAADFEGNAYVTGWSAAPGMVNGAVQVNFQVTGDGSYYFTVNGIDSDAFGVFVAP